MSMISPETYLESFKEKSRIEMVKETRKLRAEILRLETAIKNNEPCFIKPDLKTQLHYSKLYENEAITYIINSLFDANLEKDPTWTNVARDFILVCREVELTDLGLEELVEYFTVDTDVNDLKSYEKFEHFKKYNNKAINNILDCPAKTKLSYYNIMQTKLKEFPLWFNENKEVPRQCNKQQENIQMVSQKPLKQKESQFENAPYEFYLYDSLGGITFKLSKRYFALKRHAMVFEIIDVNRTKLLWRDFLKFVKTARPYKPTRNKKSYETGVVVEEYWKNPIKTIFTKLPDINQAIEYLLKIFSENGYNVIE